MIGIPTVLATRQDWLHTYEYVQTKNEAELKKQFRERLIALKGTRYMKVLKAGVSAEPEEQTPEDFEEVIDAASPFVQSGLIEGEIDQMIGALN